MNSTMTENTSGQGSNAIVPPEIQGWNWGAFLLTWIWGLGNNVLLALLTLVPIVGLVMWFVLGVKGSEWAWQQKRWDDVEHFRRVQRAWAKWGVVVWLACVVLATVFVALTFFVITAAMKSTEPYRTAVADLHANAAAMAELGEPVTTGMASGSMHVDNDEGEVDFQIAVRGTSKSGVLYVHGERSEGRWHYDRVDLVIGSQHINLGSEEASGRDDSSNP